MFFFYFSYTQDFIKKAPNNESAWNYLKGYVNYRPVIGYLWCLFLKHAQLKVHF